MTEAARRDHALSRLAVGAFRLRPVTGRFWLDAAYLVFIGALQFTVLPAVTGAQLYLDLLTPLVVVHFVRETLVRSVGLGGLAALIVETHSAAPGGLYLSAYWILLVSLHLLRPTLSWRYAFPWVVTLAVTELWVIGYEAFVTYALNGSAAFTWEHLAHAVARCAGSTAIGYFYCRAFLTPLASDEEGAP